MAAGVGGLELGEGGRVLELFAGGGWYTKILLQYLGSEGTLIAADYPMEIWPNFAFGTEEFIAKRATWPADFLQKTADEGNGWYAGITSDIFT